jgi:CheY-like chemotaxis protein
MENAKILIVDDDSDFTAVVKTVLESKQYNVISASDPTEGMEKIKAEKPDLLLLDVMMSTWSDGFEMARELKKDPEHKGMPILMISGVEKKTGIGFKSSAGDPVWMPVDGFLDKPVEPQVLLDQVAEILAKKA